MVKSLKISLLIIIALLLQVTIFPAYLADPFRPNLLIIARSHSEEETEHLMMHGASKVIMGEHEIARAMLGDVSSRPRPGDSQTRLSG